MSRARRNTRALSRAQWAYDRTPLDEDDPSDCYCGSPNDNEHGEDETPVCADCRERED